MSSILTIVHAMPHTGAMERARERFGTVHEMSGLDAAMRELRAGHDVTLLDTKLSLDTAVRVASDAERWGDRVQHVTFDVLPAEMPQARSLRRAITADGQHVRPIHTREGLDRHGRRVMFAWFERDTSEPHELELAAFNATLEPHPGGEAVVFDMDGTLVDTNELVERWLLGPVTNFERFHSDSEFADAHQWVVDAAHEAHAAGKAVLVVTARQAQYVRPTVNWLRRVGVPVNRLHMRATNDLRADGEVKRDIVADIVADGFRITKAYDDNPQVLRLWNELGVETVEVFNPQWHR